MPLTLPPAEALFARAQQAWIARAVPPFETLRIPCEKTFFKNDHVCPTDAVVEFTVRASDGRAYARIVDADGTSPTQARGVYITGPDGTPLGFYRMLPAKPGGVAPSPPPNGALDPLVPTIASANAVAEAYDITFDGIARIDAYVCDHLTLRPLLDGRRFALRELWIDEASGNVVRLIYAHDFGDDHWGTVDYRFAPIGEERVWTIVHIEADAPAGSPYGVHGTHVASDLEDISFPATMPDADFTP